MELDKYTASLRTDLLAAAALGDEHTRQTAEALGKTAEASARLMLLTALSDFAAEVSNDLDGHTVTVRLDGTQAHADVRRDSPVPGLHDGDPAEPVTEDYPTMDDVSGEVRRVTLRLVEQIKERAEDAANNSGVSLNSWLSQAVQGALRDQMRKDRGWNN
ncbi:hypothetical protein CH251_19020 [Rhodococcus sp. 06-462-5]|uniref:hypothetical protein n=1 Tax=unclassified Rhodococcus (in: high G+C Gram-positive bacteria) TaxID=192944 RepID=UPI000B9A7F90|nr:MULTISPECIES: hypothetical protein [unclassified Rhodococcus (in: high G+C Gram-positive bacteria)]MDZ7932705.1 hypothetical protein [Rhodococcus sp. (in: high G+C Gram-positive bacteria)]OZC70563.1 hypothetical protein CH251_19020 [Rhodococcus sp. 06-462-5]OZE69073.1 hypothetical protein CH270_04990 [Rhodococcus sp. 02-925g]RMB76068.1 hypothetical protein AYK61_05320 [Rhodococcus sp. SBT000017]